MSRFGFLSAIFLSAAVGQSAQAQGLQNIQGPAENPPAGYTGSQYVDSRGCSYIRAGRGVTTWVPRVTRSREHMCGLRPSVARRTQPAATPAPQVVTRRVNPQPQVVTRQAPTSAVVAAAPAAPAVSAPVRRTVSGNCPGRSASAQAYTNSGSGVRCGPQQWTPSNRVTNVGNDRVSGGGIAAPVEATRTKPQTHISTERRNPNKYPPTWVGPNPNDRVQGTPRTTTPNGYRPVWKDDRLNTQRGLNNGNKRVVVRETTSRKATYVQAGSFASSGEASAAANALRRQGLPAKVGVGQTRSVILIGPYNSQSALDAALRRARSAGYNAKVVR